MAYIVDSDVLISAKNQHYGFDFCPAFWEWLVAANAAGTVHSIDAVYNELSAGDDDLADWASDNRSFFHSFSVDDVAAVGAVNRWANDSPDFEPAAKAEFASAADSFLIGHAAAGGHTVVTHERISNGRKRIKIPNAAIPNGVSVVTPFQMLRIERARFVMA